MMVRDLGIALAIAITIVVLFQRFKAQPGMMPAPGTGMTTTGLLWRLASAVAIFLFCYFAAGTLIYPYVKSYYQVRIMPEPVTIAATAVLKAIVLIAAAWLALRTVPNRKDACLILTTAFPAIGVISLMLHRNDIMPPAIRWVHTMEMTPYYALCGFVFAMWFGPARKKEISPAEGCQA
ncbi:MAG: hypothetical protein ACLP7O_04430 [Terracidiphilus sp.]